jgi:hypothetical protein
MAGDGPRLRRALDPHALVAPERDAVTGHLTAHARRRKHDRSRPRSRHLVRHVLRTPAGLAATGAIVVGAIVAGVLVANAGSGASPTAVQQPGDKVSGAPAPTATTVPNGVPVGAPPPACDILTSALARQTMGKPMKQQAPQNNSCSYWSTEQPSHDFVSMGWTLGSEILAFRQETAGGNPDVNDVPSLGEGAFGYPSKTTVTSPTSRQWTPAGVVFAYRGVLFTVYLGRTKGDSRAIDPAGDEQEAIALAEKLFGALQSDAISLG